MGGPDRPGAVEAGRGLLCALGLRLVSGGQTGVDRAALDWAIAHGIPHGGWCPAGRVAEDGVIDPRYHLREVAAGGYRERTRRNVEHSDGTLILNLGALDGGTLETERFATRLRRPLHLAQLDQGALAQHAAAVAMWLRANAIATLNVAGPRASKRPAIYGATVDFLNALDALTLPCAGSP